MRRLLLVAAAALAVSGAARALPPAEPPVVTQHRMSLGGQALAYTAETGRIAIRDAETGEPKGWMFYVAYRLPSERPRPLTFVWNGGPGANSATLHFEVAGPRIGEAGRLLANAHTWLPATDLVFVDPIGTGFSRPAKAEYAAEFYGTVGDVASVTEFVRAWRILHAAEAAPLYLAGESWGAGRAASVGHALLKRGIDVDGLVLISGGSGLRGGWDEVEVSALRVANLSLVGLHRGRLPRELGREPATVQAAAERWARETYAPALRRAPSLSPGEREQVARDLARYTGFPAEKIDRRTLVIQPRQFRTELIAGKTLNIFDMRVTDAPRGEAREAILRYLRSGLGYRTDLPYVGLEPLDQAYSPDGRYPQGVGARWDYATGPVTPEQRQAAIAEAVRTGAGPPQLGPPLPATAEAVALKPALKVLVAAGVYDSLANCAGNEFVARSLAAPLKASVQFRCYSGGHMMYRDPDTRAVFSRDVKAFVAGRPLP